MAGIGNDDATRIHVDRIDAEMEMTNAINWLDRRSP